MRTLTSKNFQEPRKIQHTTSDYKIYHYDNVSSTNDLAKEFAEKSCEEKIVILAETQTRGKGRKGRHWVSPEGGIWLSIILRPKISPKETTKVTFIMSSTVAKTIQQMFGLVTEVKWPNDVLLSGRKICGILTETSIKDNIEFAVVGVGINANIDLDSFPHDLRDNITTLKHELGFEIKRKTLIENLLQNFENRYRQLQQGNWSTLLREWKGLATFLGKQVKVTSFDEILVGKALNIDEDGALVIKSENGELKKVVTGDVMLKD